MSATEQGGRPRANRAEDWNRRPPAEVVVTKDSYSDERLRLARSRRNRQLLGQPSEDAKLRGSVQGGAEFRELGCTSESGG